MADPALALGTGLVFMPEQFRIIEFVADSKT